MRMAGLLGAAVAFSVLTPIAPANASLSVGDLMYTDLFLWPNWREILGKYDCPTELEFYLWNAPSRPAPVTITPPPVFDPVVVGPSDPTGRSGGDPPGVRRQARSIRPGRRVRQGGDTPAGASPGALNLGHASARLRGPRLHRFSAQKGTKVSDDCGRAA
jgi:hypothetical protein